MDNVRCSSWAHWKVRVVDFLLVIIEFFSLGVTDEALRAKIDRKSAISLQRGHFNPKFETRAILECLSLEVCSRQGAIQIHVYLYLYLTLPMCRW